MVTETQDNAARVLAKLSEMYQLYCVCNGPQPTHKSARTQEHERDCTYRLMVEIERPGTYGPIERNLR
jgi:hypothetical protein